MGVLIPDAIFQQQIIKMQLNKRGDRHLEAKQMSSKAFIVQQQQTNILYPLKILYRNFLIQVLVTFTQNEINFQLLNSYYSIKIGFWSVFQSFINSEQQKGFIVKANQGQVYIFYTQNYQIINHCKQFFSKIGIIKGFYEDYKPIEKIGAGKSSAVFLARKRDTKQKYAIKAFFKNDMKDDPLSEKALQNQISILRLSKNSNIIKFKAFYETNKSFYLVTQFIEGKTLRNLLQTSELKYFEIINIVKNLLNGLSYLSSINIAHRDLKPQNIIIQKDSNRAVIVDFGLATFCLNEQDYLYKHCGTPGYIAPQILDQQFYQVKPKSDIFSLGIILHLLFLKKFPYKNATPQTIIRHNKQADFNFQSHQYSQICPQILDLFRKMLSKNQDERISAQELLEFLNSKQSKQSKITNLTRMRKNQKVKDQANKGLNRSNSAKIGLKFRLQKAY